MSLGGHAYPFILRYSATGPERTHSYRTGLVHWPGLRLVDVSSLPTLHFMNIETQEVRATYCTS